MPVHCIFLYIIFQEIGVTYIITVCYFLASATEKNVWAQ